MAEPKKTVLLCEACGVNPATAITFGKDRRPVHRCCRCWVDYYRAKTGRAVFAELTIYDQKFQWSSLSTGGHYGHLEGVDVAMSLKDRP
jgi:hypothetical protein